MQAARLLLVRCCWPNRCRPVWPVFLLLLFAMPADLAAQGKQSSDIIKFKLGDGYLIIVQAMLNDAGPFNFLLDTGATHTVIDPSLARQLQLPVIGKASLTTVSDVREDQLARLKAVRVGRSEISELGAVIDRLDQVKLKAPGIRGVLGEDFLSNFDFLIDFKERTLRLGGDAPAGDRCRFETMGQHDGALTTNRLLIAVEFTGCEPMAKRNCSWIPAQNIRSCFLPSDTFSSDPNHGADRWQPAVARMELRDLLEHRTQNRHNDGSRMSGCGAIASRAGLRCGWPSASVDLPSNLYQSLRWIRGAESTRVNTFRSCVTRFPSSVPASDPTEPRPAHPLLRRCCKAQTLRAPCSPNRSGAKSAARSDGRRALQCPCG